MNAETNVTPADSVASAPIVALTPTAIEMVKTVMQRESRGPEYALRVGVVGGGCSGFSYTMSFDDHSNADDRVMDVDGVRVLVDAASVEYLDGTTLDYVAGLHGAGFKFMNPKAQRTCGCGESFSA
jgi:iron-sulfur cluster assembly accessory protein